MRARVAVGVVSSVALGVGGFATYKNKTDEVVQLSLFCYSSLSLSFYSCPDHLQGFRRGTFLYKVAGPIVVHYRWLEFKNKRPWLRKSSEEERDAELMACHIKYAPMIRQMIDDLQGMYVKYAQMASGMTNTLPPEWIEEIRQLEDNCTPQPVEVVMRTILEETGKPADEIFSHFDQSPLGSASIGQVHRAVLASNSQEVCVKVQYPDVKRKFKNDMRTIRSQAFSLLP